MAKLGLSIGIDADVTGLRKMGRDVTGELEKLRGVTNRVGSAVSAAMAMPMIGFLSSVMQAHAEARKVQADMMAPFSGRMMMAENSAELMKMAVGQRMTQAGMDEPAARQIKATAEQQAMSALLATQKGGTVGKTLENMLESPTGFASNMIRYAEGGAQEAGAVLSELFGGNFGALLGNIQNPENQANLALGQLRQQSAVAMATGDVGQYEGLRMQIERQTYILAEIERNSKGAR